MKYITIEPCRCDIYLGCKEACGFWFVNGFFCNTEYSHFTKRQARTIQVCWNFVWFITFPFRHILRTVVKIGKL